MLHRGVAGQRSALVGGRGASPSVASLAARTRSDVHVHAYAYARSRHPPSTMRLAMRVLSTAPPGHPSRNKTPEIVMTIPDRVCKGCGGGDGDGDCACAALGKPCKGAGRRKWQRRWRGCGARASLWLAASGGLLLAAGAACAALWPILFRFILHKELSLSPSSTSFHVWKDTPVPITLEFYFFNWTNPEEINDLNTKPILVEMGPYVFREEHEKVDLKWNKNGTMSFRQIRRWYFDDNRSNGSLDDEITTLNVVAITAAFHTRYWNYFLKKSLSLSLGTLGQEIHETHSVRELLFDGYSSVLISMAQSMPALANIPVPYDRFGWFYSRNGSSDYDGHFNMHTGADDLSLLGKLSRWNGNNFTDYFPESCGQVNGSAGELWPPGRKRDSVQMFSPDLCRSIDFNYEEDSNVEGVDGFEYVGGAELLGNTSECFCGGECVRAGVLNVSTCRFGAPAFVSYPHFLHADPWYAQQVEGVRPDEGRHRFYLTLEPTTGIPLDVAARFQINILLQPYKYISMLGNVPRIFFPMCWFEERATISPDMARSLRLLLALPRGGVAVAALVAAAGALLLAFAALLWRRPAARFDVTNIPLKTPAKGKTVLQRSEIDSESEVHQRLNVAE